MKASFYKTGKEKVLLWKKSVGLSWAAISLLVLSIIMAGTVMTFLAVAR